MSQVFPTTTSNRSHNYPVKTVAVIFALALLFIAIAFFTDRIIMDSGSADVAIIDSVWPLRKH